MRSPSGGTEISWPRSGPASMIMLRVVHIQLELSQHLEKDGAKSTRDGGENKRTRGDKELDRRSWASFSAVRSAGCASGRPESSGWDSDADPSSSAWTER